MLFRCSCAQTGEVRDPNKTNVDFRRFDLRAERWSVPDRAFLIPYWKHSQSAQSSVKTCKRALPLIYMTLLDSAIIFYYAGLVWAMQLPSRNFPVNPAYRPGPFASTSP